MSPFQSSRMTWRASASISCRTSIDGHRCPSTCSFRASPVPTPRKKRPSKSRAVVAAAWATIAGWVRRIGQVTPVPTRTVDVVWATPPRTDQTNGLWPCSSIQGWKWSEMDRKSKPGLLGQAGVAHQVGRSVLLAGECVAPRGHGPSSTPDPVRVNRAASGLMSGRCLDRCRPGYRTTQVVSAARGPPASELRSPLSRRVLSYETGPGAARPAGRSPPVLGRFPGDEARRGLAT